MRFELRRLSGWVRGIAIAVIALLGLVAIVGSGGGGLGGFPPCDAWWCSNGPPPPPLPSATVQPAYVTAQVGTAVTFTAVASNFTGSLTYQWHKSSDNGSTFVDIPGATGKTFTLAGVNLADDGTWFNVTVRGDNGAVPSLVGHLTVSATPGIVFQDGEFQPADWLVSTTPDPGQVPFVHTEERLTTGGNPGAFRKMVFQVPQGAGWARLFYMSRSAAYDPSLLGAINVIDYVEDCIALPSSETTYTESALVVEQGARRYVANLASSCTLPTWSTVAGGSSLRAQDFALIDGPPCTGSEPCPDFSVSAAPLHFGYRRIAYGAGGDSIGHGIDNWKVTVWRR